MRFIHILTLLLLPLIIIQGTCSKDEEQQLSCTQSINWTGNGLDSFDHSILMDSHFRDLYYKAVPAPIDICPEALVKATFKCPSVNGDFVHNILTVSGIISWGDQKEMIELPFSDADHAYIGTIDSINLKPYFDAHPTPDGSGFIEVNFVLNNLSVGNEEVDKHYVNENVTSMNAVVDYVKKE